jgi:hypothetical protein
VVGRRHWEATRLPFDNPPPLIAFSGAPRPLAVWIRPASPQAAQAAR